MEINNEDDLYEALRAVSQYIVKEAGVLIKDGEYTLGHKLTTPTARGGKVTTVAKVRQLKTRRKLILDVKLEEDI